MPELPRPFRRFLSRYPAVEKAHMELSLAVNREGPLDARSRRLVRLGIAIGQQSPGAVTSQVRRALEDGIPPEEVRHAALLALPTLGFPPMIAALDWVEAALEQDR